MPLWMPDSSINVSTFCCFAEGYDAATHTCSEANLGSRKPFELDPGQIIHDRALGITTEVAAAETLTRTILPTASVDANATQNENSTNATVIAAGIAVPLGVMLLASLAAIAILTKRLRSLSRARKEEMASMNHHHDQSTFLPPPSIEKPGPQASHMEPDTQAHRNVHEASPDSQRLELSAKQNLVGELATPPRRSPAELPQ